ncbi:MAG: DNA polymerase III subunit delta [Calditrichaeota bacterium]|nr:DNA polymerase III subunit delta [Calditrichota bacterium]
MKSFDNALNEIQSGKIEPVYLLVGAEKFFHDQFIQTLSGKLFTDRGSRDLNEIILYGTENTESDVLSQLSSYPMLANQKLVVVREFDKMKIQDEETFEKHLKKPPKFSVLVLSSAEQMRTKFFQKLTRLVTTVDCRPIAESRLPFWVKNYCQQRGYSITPEAAHFLITNAGTHILILKNEIEKVISFKGEKTAITVDDLQETSGMYRETNVFTLQRALAKKHLGKSIQISHQLAEAGFEPTAINAVLFAFFRKALMIASLRRQGLSAAQISQKMKLQDFQMREISDVLNYYSFSQLKKVVQLLHGFDKAQKGIDSTESPNLEILCYKICRT